MRRLVQMLCSVMTLYALVMLGCSKGNPTVPQAQAGCIVGDIGKAPFLSVTSYPPDCCYGGWAGTISGRASNVNTDSVHVVLYAQTNVFWVQPYANSPYTHVSCDSVWSNSTHGGFAYHAILAKASWVPPSTMGYLPPIGGDILAIVSVPVPQRFISMFGYTWWVKESQSVRVDPGPNYFSSDPSAVWLDGQSKLHLTIKQIGGLWRSTEVYTDQYLGRGLYEFELEGPIDALDVNAVVAGFNYTDNGDEIDMLECSRWGSASGPNGQFVVQPWDVTGNRYQFTFTTSDVTSCTCNWLADRIEFEAREGRLGENGRLLAAWTYTGVDNPPPGTLRMRFNLWQYNNAPPADGQTIEVVVSNFRFTPSGGNPVQPTTWGSIKAMYRK